MPINKLLYKTVIPSIQKPLKCYKMYQFRLFGSPMLIEVNQIAKCNLSDLKVKSWGLSEQQYFHDKITYTILHIISCLRY